ncbi:MAG: OFA family MFS transporter [Pseudomonadota bacterium]|nr:OFA family MFS transporter [Pseudomonadota bacterium]
MEGISAPSERPTSGGLLDRARTIARPGFNRWMVPPAALAIHLCIGMAYGFSVFWLPLTRQLGVDHSIAPPADTTLLTMLFSTQYDWRVSDVTVLYTLFFVFLGSAAAIWGGWLERVGPRRAGVFSALLWCGGLVLSAIGIYLHQLWMMWLGSGVLGGIGLGLGYISPVSTLIKWFPDKRGMATGMAIMGFGGGALIGSPLADMMMNKFGDGVAARGVWQTFVALALIYAVFMLGGAFSYRVPPSNWAPEGWTAPVKASGMITTHNVHLRDAHKTPQFWLIWFVLMLNVSAGIGVLAIASPMLQFVFGGGLIGLPGVRQDALNPDQARQVATIAAGFVGLVSLFNIGGRFLWASVSDRIGRKLTYATFFVLGAALYTSAPWAASIGSVALFVSAMCIIVSMYGGGFATVPAYLADVFGTQYVGAIHGRLLTAWSTAGVLGPIVITQVPQLLQDRFGVPRGESYTQTLYILAAFLAVGFVCNLLVRPVAARWFMRETNLSGPGISATPETASQGIGRGGFSPTALVAWALVGGPLAWGIWMTLNKALILFK